MFPKIIGSSGVIEWPTEARLSSQVPCIICGNNASLEEVTAGSCYADGRQAFACHEHTWNKSSWLLAWIRFSLEQTAMLKE